VELLDHIVVKSSPRECSRRCFSDFLKVH